MGERAWGRYLTYRARVEAAYGLDREAVGAIVARMRTAAATQPVRCFLLVDGEGAEVGAVGRLIAAWAGQRFWRLQDVDVFPAFRGRGYGNALLEAVMGEAAGDGATAVIVAADEDDGPLAWYRRRGFMPVATVAKPRSTAFAGLGESVDDSGLG